MIRAIAEKIKAWLEARFGIAVPIVDRPPANNDAAIATRRSCAGRCRSRKADAARRHA